MAIEELQCHEFRNLKNATFTFNSKLNLIIGKNGSGKSSLLESIYTLSTSKSFRTQHLKNCITHNANKFILFGKYNNHTIGIQKESIKLLTKVNNQIINKRSELAKIQSVLVIDSSSFDLLLGGKQKRREFLDWALFHVEPSFSDIWIKYKNILKQRNYLLRNKNLKEIVYWDKYLINFNEQINQFRSDLLKKLIDEFRLKNKKNEILNKVTIEYSQGWKKNQAYQDALNEKLSIDIKRGFTSVGSHKCDIKFLIDNKEIKDIFSRGQTKLLVINLYLILMDYVYKNTKSRPIFIIDDLVAELDKNTIKDVIVSLVEKDYQVFVSSIEYDDFFKQLKIEKTVFHVKHGEIKTQKL